MVLKPCEVETTIKVNSSKFEIEEEGNDNIDEERDDDDDIIMAPEWDVDSFDGLEYYSSPEAQLSSDEQPLSDEEEALENYRIVKRQLIESKGFYVEPERRLIYLFKGIKPMSLDRNAIGAITFREYWEEMVRKVELVEVVRGNYRGGARAKSYITFMAREKPNGPLVEYQAKCMDTLDGKSHPILCRPVFKPKPFS
ncbi:unnamed protein product [Arabidopsis arenosa]|uniref:Cystatin domain-containing protein n=1 Tax=Arabidopsis arenosa TaxID=38785 RepID=A0A8S2AXR9_ARAAE|nr:unnamed protein product [Arabidopsis arenosa]